MDKTTNYQLNKPAGSDFVDISALNENMDVIDQEMKAQGDLASGHVGNKSNPHNVTKEQLGLDNVPNVATNDQTPTYTAASTLSALVSGEKLSVAFGKIAKAVADLISHIANKSNPHGVTASQIGAAAASHGTHVTFSTTVPAAPGTAAVGSATTVSRSDHVHPVQTTITGNAGSATKLATARNILVNLASTTAASFNGTAAANPGVTGTLPAANGGTGKASWTANRLVYPSAATTLTQLAFPSVAGSVLRQGTSGAPYWTSLADLMTAMDACGLIFGTYTGDSAKSRSFNLGFAPKAVLVCSQEGVMGVIPGSIYSYGGLALPGAPVTRGIDEEVVIVTDTGFSINAPNDYCRVNQKGNIYRYFAVK